MNMTLRHVLSAMNRMNTSRSITSDTYTQLTCIGRVRGASDPSTVYISCFFSGEVDVVFGTFFRWTSKSASLGGRSSPLILTLSVNPSSPSMGWTVFRRAVFSTFRRSSVGTEMRSFAETAASGGPMHRMWRRMITSMRTHAGTGLWRGRCSNFTIRMVIAIRKQSKQNDDIKYTPETIQAFRDEFSCLK